MAITGLSQDQLIAALVADMGLDPALNWTLSELWDRHFNSGATTRAYLGQYFLSIGDNTGINALTTAITNAQNDIITLQTGKANTVHTHVIADITDLGTFMRNVDAVIYETATPGTYPARSTATSDTLRRVRWVGTLAPTSGGSFALAGDVFEVPQ